MKTAEIKPDYSTLHCPHCGFDITNELETEYGVFCPNACNAKCGDFWKSEALPKNWRALGMILLGDELYHKTIR